MPRMKLTNAEFNEKALDVKVEPSKFKRYTGEIPRTGTVLIHRVTKMWWTQSEDGTSMIKALAVAEQNTGDNKKFNGLPTWEYLVFKPEAAFRYVPFLQCFGITLRDIKSKMVVSDEPDNIGDVIESIGGWEVGSDDALCRIVINRKKWDGDWQSRVDRDGWLPLEDEDDEDDIKDDEDEDEEPPARPTSRARGRSSQDGRQASSRRASQDVEEEEDDDEDIEDDEDLDDELDDEDEDVEEEEADEDEEEAEEEPPARTRRATARPSRTPARASSAPKSTGTGRSRPASARATDGSRTRSSRSSTARTERTPGPRGSKGRDGGSREDPPF